MFLRSLFRYDDDQTSPRRHPPERQVGITCLAECPILVHLDTVDDYRDFASTIPYERPGPKPRQTSAYKVGFFSGQFPEIGFRPLSAFEMGGWMVIHSQLL
jgi:hypothetical protein